MKSTQLFLLWLFPFSSFYVQNTSQGAPMATNAIDGPQVQCEVRTTAYTRSRHGMERNAIGSQLKAGDLKSAAADWSRFPLGPSRVGTDPPDTSQTLPLIEPKPQHDIGRYSSSFVAGSSIISICLAATLSPFTFPTIE